MLNTIDKLNIAYNGIFYNNKPMTQSEQMHYLLSKLNLIIEHFNILDDTTREKIKELEETVDYYMNSGIVIETEKYLDNMIKKGDFDKIINQKIFEDIQERLDYNKIAINNLINRVSIIEERLESDTNHSSYRETKLKNNLGADILP